MKANKNIVKVGRLKEIIAANIARKNDIEAKRKALGVDMSMADEADIKDQKILNQIEDQNRRYGAMVKNPERFKPKTIVKTTIIKKAK
jgi:hypothetical protein